LAAIAAAILIYFLIKYLGQHRSGPVSRPATLLDQILSPPYFLALGTTGVSAVLDIFRSR
jgi:hypothetical protein